MASISHAKTNNIPDWTQAELDAQIALGRFPVGTLLADIVLHGDWNAAHTITPVGRIITAAGAVTMVAADDIVEIAKTVAADTVVNLPVSPVNFKIYTIKDGAGVAFTHNITLTPPSGDIDGQTTFAMATNYESESFYFNGTNWRLV